MGQPQLSHSNQIGIPKPNTLVDHFMRFTFIADPEALNQYSKLNEAPPPPPPQKPEIEYMDRMLGK